MVRTGLIALAALALSSCSGSNPREEAPRVDMDTEWAQVPDGVPYGELSAVDVDSHGHVFVLHRAGREWVEPFPADPIADPTVFMFASNGKLLGKWGAGTLVMPHGLSIDDEDKVWITDVAREQVLRFSHDGEEELAIGTRGVSGDDDAHFGRPADVAFSGGRVLVADGYVNDRIALFDREGNFIEQWGGAGSAPGQFNLPHAIATDSDRVYVADRENARIQVFSLGGDPLAQWSPKGTGHPYAVRPIGSGYVVVIEGRDRAGRYGAIGRIYREDGSLERVFDAGIDPRTGASLGHDIAVGRDGNAYMVDNKANRMVKFELASAGLEDADGD